MLSQERESLRLFNSAYTATGNNQSFSSSYNSSLTSSTSSTRPRPPPTQSIIFDNHSIPIVDYGYIDNLYIGLQRNPITVAQTVLRYYEAFKRTGNENALHVLINNSNWLAENAVNHGNYSIFEYKFPYPIYGMKPIWRSGMAQGQGVQALIKAFQITGENKYLEAAKKLLNSFFVEVKNGGVTYKNPKQGWWYEEYASTTGNQSRVLNGMIYTVLGIYDYYNLTHDSVAKFLFDQGVLALKNNLRYYDNNGYSYYDILGKVSPRLYHLTHIGLLQKLYNVAKDPTFKFYLDRWKNHSTP
jgi:hypothetical protein